MPAHVLDTIRRRPETLRLPLEPMHGWRSSPDDGDHTHCWCCGRTVELGGHVVGCYHEYVSIVFCPGCVADNPELFREWMASRPG